MTLGLAVSIEPLPAAKDVRDQWLDLEARSEASIFLSWAWIGCWLECLPGEIKPQLLRVVQDGRLVGLGILVARGIRRNLFIRSRGLYLNCTGDPALDEIGIEHNGFLSERGHEAAVMQAAVAHLAGHVPDWDEFFLRGIDPRVFGDSPAPPGFRRFDAGRAVACRYVDLVAVRSSGKPFVDHLGKSTRHKARRSVKEFERQGALALDEAPDVDTARRYLSRLEDLHQRYWTSRGHPGSFSNAFLVRFHDAMLARSFADGRIQVLRITAGDKEVGYLYNHVYRGRAYNYQSGFHYIGQNQHQRPGLVSHILAVEHNLRLGHAVYDLLAGDSFFKRSMTNAEIPMAWQVLQRGSARFGIEAALRRVRRMVLAQLKGRRKQAGGRLP